jgi:hypothetical protein
MFLGNSQQAALRTGSVIDQHGLESFPNSFLANSRTKGLAHRAQIHKYLGYIEQCLPMGSNDLWSPKRADECLRLKHGVRVFCRFGNRL